MCQCIATTALRRSRGDYLKWVGGKQCTKLAAYVDDQGRGYCHLHAKNPPPDPISQGR